MRPVVRMWVVACVLLCAGAARGGLVAGRAGVGDGADPFRIGLSAGQVKFNEGTIRETRRAYDRGDQEDYSGYLSNYTLDELGFTDNYLTVGLTMEKQWRYLTIQLQGAYLNPKANAVAYMHQTDSNVPPDRRGYYIGVDEVTFNGKKYEYMWIPDGTSFDSEIQGGTLEWKMMITPFSLTFGDSHLAPWVHLGVYGVGGHYEIDAGPAQGVIEYEIPPKEYVVRGKGSGWAAMAVPEVGAGVELKLKAGELNGRDITLTFVGDGSVMSYNGDPNAFGFNVNSTRHVDFSFFNLKFDAIFEFPIGRRTDLFLGAGYRIVSTDVSMDSIHRTEEEQEDLSEKYDKHADIRFSQWTATLGLRF